MLSTLAPILVSFLVTALITPLVIALAHRLDWVARPRDDRWHRKPTALMGGIGIFAGTFVSWIVTGDAPARAPLLLPAVLMFILGAVDDRLRLRPHIKLIGQLAAGALLILAGV